MNLSHQTAQIATAQKHGQKIAELLSKGPEVFSNWYELNKEKIADANPIFEYVRQKATSHLLDVNIIQTGNVKYLEWAIFFAKVGPGNTGYYHEYIDYTNWAIVYMLEWQNNHEQKEWRKKEQEKILEQRNLERQKKERARTTDSYKQQAKHLFD